MLTGFAGPEPESAFETIADADGVVAVDLTEMERLAASPPPSGDGTVED